MNRRGLFRRMVGGACTIVAGATTSVGVGAQQQRMTRVLEPQHVVDETSSWQDGGRVFFVFRYIGPAMKSGEHLPLLVVGERVRIDARQYGGPFFEGVVQQVENGLRPRVQTVLLVQD